MDAMMELRSGEGRFDMLIRWLGLRDPQRNQVAVTMLSRLGTPATPLLVHEAIKPGKRSAHRIAILDVVERIGGPLGPDEMFGLQSLLGHRDPGVGQKAEEVIVSLSPGSVPKSPEGLAMMRVFNPFLQLPPRRSQRKTRNSEFKEFCREAIAAAKRLAKSKKARQRREAGDNR